MKPVRVLGANLPVSRLGEGAFWDRASGSLFWVDIVGQVVSRFEIESRKHESWTLPKPVSFAYPNDGRLVLCLSDGVYDFDPTTGDLETVAALTLPSEHRLNDGKLDPEGRLWVGTINTSDQPQATAALYLLNDARLDEIEGGYVNANGKTWSPDGKILYHADTARGTIWQYDYNLATGEISNKRVFVRNESWHPDRLCSDTAGSVYAAIYGGSRVDVFDRRGDLQRSLALPVPNPTSCVIGGETDSQLFVTSACDGMSPEQLAHAPLSGQVFVMDLD